MLKKICRFEIMARRDLLLAKIMKRNFLHSGEYCLKIYLTANNKTNRNYKFPVRRITKQSPMLGRKLGGLAGKINLKFSSYCDSNKSKRKGGGEHSCRRGCAARHKFPGRPDKKAPFPDTKKLIRDLSHLRNGWKAARFTPEPPFPLSLFP